MRPVLLSQERDQHVSYPSTRRMHSLPALLLIDPTTKGTMRNQRRVDNPAGPTDVFCPEPPQFRAIRGSSRNRANIGSRHSIVSSRSQQRRMHRLLSCGNTRSQKTLTQIKFVDCPPADEEDDDLDLQYIGEPAPANSRPNNTGAGGQRRKSRGTRTGAMDTTNNDTLTQMDWIRSTADAASSTADRWSHRGAVKRARRRRERQPSPIPERELWDRGGANKRRVFEMDIIQEESEPEDMDEGASRSKRVKTSHCSDGKLNRPRNFGAPNTCDAGDDQKPASQGDVDPAAPLESAVNSPGVAGLPNPTIPITPQKQRERVIPSSQSPESPEVIFLGQNELPASPSRPPLKTISHNKISGADALRGQGTVLSPESKPKGLSSVLLEECKPDMISAENAPLPERRNMTMASNDDHNETDLQTVESAGRNLRPAAANDSIRLMDGRPGMNRPSDGNNGRLESQRKHVEVVNDTDDESDAEVDGFSDGFSQLSDAEIPRSQLPRQQSDHHPGLGHGTTASQLPDLPGQQENGFADNALQSTAGSDMSILYCRRPMSYHFGPTDHDVPDLSSDGLAELFTTQGFGGRHACQASNNENAEHVETELVRESSPVQPDDTNGLAVEDNESGPPFSPVLPI